MDSISISEISTQIWGTPRRTGGREEDRKLGSEMMYVETRGISRLVVLGLRYVDRAGATRIR